MEGQAVRKVIVSTFVPISNCPVLRTPALKTDNRVPDERRWSSLLSAILPASPTVIAAIVRCCVQNRRFRAFLSQKNYPAQRGGSFR